jgi:hypothetical protein
MAYNIGRHVSLNDSFSKITEKSIDLFPPTDSAKSAFDLFPTTDNVKDINQWFGCQSTPRRQKPAKNTAIDIDNYEFVDLFCRRHRGGYF